MSLRLTLLFSTIFLTALPLVHAEQTEVLEILPNDDAYVVSDLNDPRDKLGLQKITTGNLQFLKVWYAWNVTGAEGMKVVSIAYLKFDLSKVNQDEITSGKLRLYGQNVTITSEPRFVDVHLGSDAPWQESTLTYPNAPAFPQNPAATSAVNLPGWYEWDLTSAAKQNAGAELTVAVLMESLFVNSEEQVVFVSKDANDRSLSPRMVIEVKGVSSSVSPSVPSMNVGDGTLSIVLASALGAGGAAAGFLFYRRMQQQRSSSVSSLSVKGMNTENCPSCGKKVSKDFNLCPYCEYDLRQIKCSSCGKDISKDYKVCPYCGSKISLRE